MPKKGNTVTVQSGDSWAKIAGKIYGDQRMFEELMRANNNISMLRPGQTLVLPKKQKNPYVSKFGAAATGMASEFNAQGQPLNTPTSPVATPGQNVMNKWVMNNLTRNNGTYNTSTATAQTPNAMTPPATNNQAAPLPVAANTGYSNPSNQYGSVMPSATQAVTTPAPTTVNAASMGMTAQQAQQQRAATQQAQQFNMAPTSAQNAAMRAAAAQPAPSGPAPAPNYANQFAAAQNQYGGTNQFAPRIPNGTRPATTTQAAPTPGTTPPQNQPYPAYNNPSNQYGSVRPAETTTEYRAQEGGAVYDQIFNAMHGEPGASMPSVVKGSQVQNIAFAKGFTPQQVVNSLSAAGYVYDSATQSMVQPGTQAAGYGVPQTGSSAITGGGASTLPAYRPPTYGSPTYNFVRGNKGQVLTPHYGTPQLTQVGQPAQAQPTLGTINAQWRIGG